MSDSSGQPPQFLSTSLIHESKGIFSFQNTSLKYRSEKQSTEVKGSQVVKSIQETGKWEQETPSESLNLLNKPYFFNDMIISLVLATNYYL